MERMEEDMYVMMNLFQTFTASLQMLTSISIGFTYLVNVAGKKHPVPMNMASSFEVCFLHVIYHYSEFILTIIFSDVL